MIGKLLCFLGLHRWIYGLSGTTYTVVDRWNDLERDCVRCKKRQVFWNAGFTAAFAKWRDL